MHLSVFRSGRTISVSFRSLSRTMSLRPKSACSASAARAFVTTSQTRSSITSTSTACMLQMTKSRRRPTKERTRLLIVQARRQSLRLERPRSYRSQRRRHTHTSSHIKPWTHIATLFRPGLPRRLQLHPNEPMISLRSAVEGELHTTGIFTASASARGPIRD